MKKYVMTRENYNRKSKNFIATQAVYDVTSIAQSIGYKKKVLYKGRSKNLCRISNVILLIQMCFLKKKSIVLYQLPLTISRFVFPLVIFCIKKKEFGLITIIHDLNMYRAKSIELEKKEMSILNLSSVIISHNKEMTKFLILKGISSKKIIELDIFDYLVTDIGNEMKKEECILNKSIIIAGNLMPEKCGYLYDMIDSGKGYFDIYGTNYLYKDKIGQYSNVKYHGAFPAPELPHVIRGGFGLVWDGDSMNTCNGNFGEYLKINNPHKTSLYLASGIPIIIWSKAALADFVVENNIGFTVETLDEAIDKVAMITEEEYQVMKENAMIIGLKLRNGEYTKKAIKNAEEILLKNSFREDYK